MPTPWLAAGYSVIALNNVVPLPLRDKDACRFSKGLPCHKPYERSALHKDIPPQPLVSPLRHKSSTALLQRITVVEEASKAKQPLAVAVMQPLLDSYDVVAVASPDLDAVEASLRTGRVDMVSVDCSGKLDWPLRPSLVSGLEDDPSSHDAFAVEAARRDRHVP
jgi:hypothetical protein